MFGVHQQLPQAHLPFSTLAPATPNQIKSNQVHSASSRDQDQCAKRKKQINTLRPRCTAQRGGGGQVANLNKQIDLLGRAQKRKVATHPDVRLLRFRILRKQGTPVRPLKRKQLRDALPDVRAPPSIPGSPPAQTIFVKFWESSADGSIFSPRNGQHL